MYLANLCKQPLFLNRGWYVDYVLNIHHLLHKCIFVEEEEYYI